MTHRIKRTSLALFLVFCFIALTPVFLITASASVTHPLDAFDTDSQGIVYELYTENNTASVYYADDTISGDIVIPDYVSKSGVTYTVMYIDFYAFFYCSDIESVTIPQSITTIEEGAFMFCAGLTDINIQNGVEKIGDAAFVGCESLTSINIPASVTDIGEGVFLGCYGLESITVASGSTSYSSDNGVLFNKSKSTLIQYPIGHTRESFSVLGGVTEISPYAFYESILSSISIPSSVTEIGMLAFFECYNLTSITVDSSSQNYSNDTFGVLFDKDKKTLIHYPIGKTETEYIIPNGVETIDAVAFYFCESLTAITFPQGLNKIGEGAFWYCTGLSDISLPDSVDYIGMDAFYLTDWYENQPNGLIYAGKVAYEYKGNMPPNTTITLLDGTKGIAEGAFFLCDRLVGINIPDSVTVIGDGAFWGCDSLVDVIIPRSVSNIGEDTFSGCEDIVLNVYRASYAHNYAQENDIPFVLIQVDWEIIFEEDYAVGIIDERSVDDIIAKLDSTVVVKNIDGDIITGDAKVGTGCTISYNGNDYTVIVKGDTNGDGIVNAKDYLAIKRAFLGTLQLTETQLKAACLEDTELPTSKDYLRIKRHFLGTFNIYE